MTPLMSSHSVSRPSKREVQRQAGHSPTRRALALTCASLNCAIVLAGRARESSRHRSPPSGILLYVTQAQVSFETRRLPRECGQESAAELFVRTERRLGVFLAQMVRDRALAEDLLQDTFHDVLRAGAELASVENVDAWLFAIARNRALAALRRRRRLMRVVARLGQRRDIADEDADVVALREFLRRRLSPDELSLLLLRYVHGFGAGELGRMSGRTPDAVRQRLSRMRAKLLAAAQEEGWEWNE